MAEKPLTAPFRLSRVLLRFMESQEATGGPADDQSFEAFVASENAAEGRAPVKTAEPAPKAPQTVPEVPAAAEETPTAEPLAAKSDKGERNEDGTFKPKGKPRNDPQARIDQQTAKQREAERQRDEARAEAAHWRAQVERRVSQQPAVLPSAQPAETPQAAWKRYMAHPDAPKREQFEDPAEFSIAANYFINELRDQERAAHEQRALGQQLDAHRATQFHERGIAKDPKFFENLQARIMAEGDPPINLPTQDYIKASPLGPDLLVYLLDNPDDAQRLSTLPPLESREAIAEIAGILKARSTAASQAPRQAPVLSRAPAPIQPLGGSLTPSGDASDDDVPFEEFYRRENAKQQRR